MSRHQYVVTLAERDKPLRQAIREAVDRALATRTELRDSHVMIVSPNWRPTSRGTRQPPSTHIRGPNPEAVRLLMNIVGDVTCSGVAGELLPT